MQAMTKAKDKNTNQDCMSSLPYQWGNKTLLPSFKEYILKLDQRLVIAVNSSYISRKCIDSKERLLQHTVLPWQCIISSWDFLSYFNFLKILDI